MVTTRMLAGGQCRRLLRPVTSRAPASGLLGEANETSSHLDERRRVRLPCHHHVRPAAGANDTTQHRIQQRRNFSTAPSEPPPSRLAVEGTPLSTPEGSALLGGLDVHTVEADDGHPLAAYTVGGDGDGDDLGRRTPVLLLHGRTWSSVPVYHLAGGTGPATGSGSRDSGDGGESMSLMEALYDAGSIQPYAMDFRGFGGTPRDGSGFVQPLRCVSDALSVMDWIDERHRAAASGEDGDECGRTRRPSLLGWSHGAIIAQILAQRHPSSLRKLVLYGSMYNPNVRYSIPPPSNTDVHDANVGHTDHDDFPLAELAARNNADGAMEDFTMSGSASGASAADEGGSIFPPVSARLFAKAALVADPIKVRWRSLHQLNEAHPSLVNVPSMVVAGDSDPYAPIAVQGELFTNLARGADRTWCIVSNADHAVHLSDERGRFVENVANFLESN